MNIPIELNKKLGDKVIELLRQKLNLLTWLEYTYPAVKVGKREDGTTYPQLYAQSGGRKILDLTPDSSFKSYLFFERNGINNDDEETNEYDFSLVFWGNLSVIDNTNECDYTDELVYEIMKVLTDFDCYNISVGYEDTFRKYNLHETTKQMFMYPYTTFKIEFNVIGGANC